MMLLLDTTIKVSLILLVALAAMPLLRRLSAALRHWVLAASLLSAAVVPIAGIALPRWHVTLPASPAWVLSSAAAPRPVGAEAFKNNAMVTADAAPAAAISLASAVTTIWISGVALGLGMLFFGLTRLQRVRSRSERIVTGRWYECAEATRIELGISRPVTLYQARHETLLVTWGLLKPRVLIPALAREWPEDRVRLVLHHELAHLQRRDWIVHCATELVRAVYWFNPLVWMVCARLRHESEQACDDAVISRGIDGASYAAHLVDIARHLRPRRAFSMAPAIVRPSGFERRVNAMLDARRNRRPLSATACALALAGSLAVALPISVVAGQAVSTFAGTIVDPQNALLPGVVVLLTNEATGAKHQVLSNHEGRFEFASLPPGSYVLETKLPGFAAFQARLTLTGQDVVQNLTLEVATLTETITVAAEPGDSAVRGSVGVQRVQRRPIPPRPSSLGRYGPAIGGNIRVPHKVTDVRPVYPEALSRAGVTGTVLLHARIDTEGDVREVTVLAATHPEFATAATEAVRQWQFDATLLNGLPIEVRVDATVNFVIRR